MGTYWEMILYGRSMRGGKIVMFKIFKEALRMSSKNKTGDAEAHGIMYGKW